MIPQVHSSQSYSLMYAAPHLSQPQISHSSVPPSHEYQSHMDHQTSSVPQIAYHLPPVSTQPMIEFPQLDSGLAVPMFTQGDDPIAYLNKAMAFLSAVAASSYASTGYKGNATSSEGNNAGEQARDTEDLDAYYFEYDDVSNAKAVLMDNLSNLWFRRYLRVHMLTKPQVFYDDTHKQALGYQNPFYLKKAQWIKPTLYNGSVISNQHAVIPMIDDEETLILEEVSRSKMLEKQDDPISKEKKINTTPINYVELNRLSEDFGKRFIPQQELSVEQAFWLQTSHPNTDQSDISLVKIEAPKVSLVNTSLKKLKYHLRQFETMVKKHITPDAITEGEWGFEHTKAIFLNEIIPFLKSLKDIFNVFDKDFLNEVTEVKIVFNQMEAAVQQCSIDKQCFEIHKKELFLENDRLEHCESLIAQLNSKSMENADLKGQIQEKVFVTTALQNELRKLKDPLAHRLWKNRDEHIDYLKYTQEQANILQGIVESSKTPDSNTPVLPSTGLKSSNSASRSHPTGN
ncbi:hypothetical protein Tco_0571447 [Tanacetum coccineum]